MKQKKEVKVNPKSLKKAILLKEIIDKPIALRNEGKYEDTRTHSR